MPSCTNIICIVVAIFVTGIYTKTKFRTHAHFFWMCAWCMMLIMTILQYERKYQISNGAFSSVFCIKRRGSKNKTLYAAKVRVGKIHNYDDRIDRDLQLKVIWAWWSRGRSWWWSMLIIHTAIFASGCTEWRLAWWSFNTDMILMILILMMRIIMKR